MHFLNLGPYKVKAADFPLNDMFLCVDLRHDKYMNISESFWRNLYEIQIYTVNREMFTTLKVGEFAAFFQFAVDKIPHLLHRFNG
jgi:hypothetical protein